MSTCAIIPPHILEAMALSGDPRLEQSARETLRLTAERERARYGAPSALSDMRPAPYPSAAERSDAAGPRRTIHDARGEQTLPGEVVREEGADATGDEAVDQAYDGLGATWSLWHEVYRRSSLDDKGLPLVASVHYGTDYDNAFWDGSQMVFGDGDGEVFLGFTRSLDVIGHELAHGVTQYTSGLNYQGQSGALNEHVSDVFGILVKQRTLGQDASAADWLIGADLLADGVNGVALRSMAAPGTAYDDPRLGKDPQPGHLRDYVETSDDHGGVHINSGIPNKAFHLVATTLGGPAWEVPGRIWYAAITGDIKADCDFATFADLTIAAARAAHGDTSPEARAVSSAWEQVGVTGSSEPSGEGGAVREREATPSSSAEVVVRRTGGFAGTVRERAVVLDDLPSGDARRFRALLDEPDTLRALAARPAPHPDAYCYGLTCAEPPLDVSIAEPALPEVTRELFDRTLRGEAEGGIAHG